MAAFPPVQNCRTEGRESQTVVSDLDGTLLRGRSSFPYFVLMAFEGSGAARAAALLLLSPVAWFLYHFVSEAAGIKLLIFVSLRGLREAEIKLVARAVLPSFYLRDLHADSWARFSSFGRRLILTANPRIMVEPLGLDYLGADRVVGTEIEFDGHGRATGFVRSPGVLVGLNKRDALKALTAGAAARPDVGLGDRTTDYPFMSLCREGYVVLPDKNARAVPKEELPRPVLFHDGRWVKLPTPGVALLTLLWAPLGFALAVIRIAAGALLPMPVVYWAFRALGVRVVVRGKPPGPMGDQRRRTGVLFVCSHRTLLDPIFLSAALGRPVTAVTYSISRLSEFLSPIRTVQLSRDRKQDARTIHKLLQEGDLVICPEGTTSREPFLLRFSALFAELADRIVPVATNCHMSVFHGTTARGWKGMDPFYFFMNPNPTYEVTFLEQLPKELTCGGGKTAHEVANYIQRILARTLGFECTNFTRKDKYRVLAGNDGTVPVPVKTTSRTVLNASKS